MMASCRSEFGSSGSVRDWEPTSDIRVFPSRGLLWSGRASADRRRHRLLCPCVNGTRKLTPWRPMPRGGQFSRAVDTLVFEIWLGLAGSGGQQSV
jgi:hypothetical protein